MERERKLMDDWMQDVKERLRVEKQHLEERISLLEPEAARPRAPSASGSATHARRSVSHSDDPYPTSDFRVLNPEHPTDPNPSDSDADRGTTEPPTLMQTMTKLLVAQTQVMAAQALATAVHRLPPLC